MSRIFDLSFWFTLMPQPLSRGSAIFFFIFFGFFGLLALATHFLYKKRRLTLERPVKDLYSRVKTFLITSWLLGWAWLFFAYEVYDCCLCVLGLRSGVLWSVCGYTLSCAMHCRKCHDDCKTLTSVELFQSIFRNVKNKQ